MESLKNLVVSKGANTCPASLESISSLEKKLGFTLSDEYKDFLCTFGVILYKSNETYGLGVPEDYYLNVLNKYTDLSHDPTYPKSSVPLIEVGDGQYYLYDNTKQKVLLWATPHGGIVRTIDEMLEPFLIKLIFEA